MVNRRSAKLPQPAIQPPCLNTALLYCSVLPHSTTSLLDESVKFIRNAYSTDALVPDRFAFTRMFPNIACDRCTLEEYLSITLKGETL